MFAVRTTLPASLWLFLGLGSACAQGVLVQGSPMRITTDTIEYCDQLIARATQDELQRPVPQQARMLDEEGRQMCDEGKLRGGILRLRKALLLMEPGG